MSSVRTGMKFGDDNHTDPGTEVGRLNTQRGDTAANVTLPSGATGPAGTSVAGIDNWNDYTEYGQPRQTVTTTPGGTTGIGYGWLGARQRAATGSGLVLMGGRLYNNAGGAFSSADPVYGANDGGYGYPNDPINSSDVSGESPANLNKYEKALWKKHPILGSKIIWAGKMADDAAKLYYPKKCGGKNGKSIGSLYCRRADAFRHVLWMSLAVKYMKGHDEFANEWGHAHEKNAKQVGGKREGRKDLYNNGVGRAIGRGFLNGSFKGSRFMPMVRKSVKYDCWKVGYCAKIWR